MARWKLETKLASPPARLTNDHNEDANEARHCKGERARFPARYSLLLIEFEARTGVPFAGAKTRARARAGTPIVLRHCERAGRRNQIRRAEALDFFARFDSSLWHIAFVCSLTRSLACSFVRSG